ncbi:MAG: globin [Actinobacteria bacterium]|nr:globin [Actinomycetota bacterium]
MSFYDEVGGAATFEALVAAFYRGVAGDEPLRSLYPEAPELGPAERRLRMFLEQYFGGPTAYSQERGHPRLRMRHVPYAVTMDQRDRWLRHMVGALETVIADGAPIDEAHADAMKDYFVRAADMLVNTHT